MSKRGALNNGQKFWKIEDNPNQFLYNFLDYVSARPEAPGNRENDASRNLEIRESLGRLKAKGGQFLQRLNDLTPQPVNFVEYLSRVAPTDPCRTAKVNIGPDIFKRVWLGHALVADYGSVNDNLRNPANDDGPRKAA